MSKKLDPVFHSIYIWREVTCQDQWVLFEKSTEETRFSVPFPYLFINNTHIIVFLNSPSHSSKKINQSSLFNSLPKMSCLYNSAPSFSVLSSSSSARSTTLSSRPRFHCSLGGNFVSSVFSCYFSRETENSGSNPSQWRFVRSFKSQFEPNF